MLQDTDLEAVNTCEELVAMALIGEEWALISASSWKFSTDQSFMTPPRHADSNVELLEPGRKSNAHTQSLWAELFDWMNNTENKN